MFTAQNAAPARHNINQMRLEGSNAYLMRFASCAATRKNVLDASNAHGLMC